MDADVEAAWQTLVDRWDDPAGHEAFMSLVAKHGAYAWAAARYKERAGDGLADKQLERIRKAATATMFATARTKPQEEPYRRTIVIFAVLIVMLVIALVGVKLMHDAQPERAPSPPPTTKPGAH